MSSVAESPSRISADSFDEFLPTRAEWRRVITRLNSDIDCYGDESPELPDSAWYEPEDDHPHDSFLGGVG